MALCRLIRLSSDRRRGARRYGNGGGGLFGAAAALNRSDAGVAE